MSEMTDVYNVIHCLFCCTKTARRARFLHRIGRERWTRPVLEQFKFDESKPRWIGE